MREVQLTTPDLALIGGTRAALGLGLGLLLANRFSEEQRRAIGWTLPLVGAFTTIPFALKVFGRPRSFTLGWGPEQTGSEPQSEANEAQSQVSALAPT
jgi:hypothetical protein